MIADCRLKKRGGELFGGQSAIDNRKWAILAILGQTMIADTLRKTRRISQIVLCHRT
jgi:hypothetical protein